MQHGELHHARLLARSVLDWSVPATTRMHLPVAASVMFDVDSPMHFPVRC